MPAGTQRELNARSGGDGGGGKPLREHQGLNGYVGRVAQRGRRGGA